AAGRGVRAHAHGRRRLQLPRLLHEQSLALGPRRGAEGGRGAQAAPGRNRRVTSLRAFAWRGLRVAPADRRAVIDIGSNTVRLVVYDGPQRVPRTMWTEKDVARLGPDLAETGRIPAEASEQALAALARFALLTRELGVTDVQTVATAAARDAENGGEFLERVRALGLAPQLLNGEEEAIAAAYGVIGAFPDARGTVADLGGGSLELVAVEDGACRDGATLPLGTLRLPALRAKEAPGFKRAVKKAFAN